VVASYTIASYDAEAKTELDALMLENPDTAAVVRFNVFDRDVMDFISNELVCGMSRQSGSVADPTLVLGTC
jgi:hypothetical protein